jgi:hypothetical protein
MDNNKYIDEGWKESVARDRELQDDLQKDTDSKKSPTEAAVHADSSKTDDNNLEINFESYITSLIYQALIFLGEVPNPMTRLHEKNARQAKLIIDTLILIRNKTSGNLTKEESDVLNAALYELQMKFVEISQKGNGQ